MNVAHSQDQMATNRTPALLAYQEKYQRDRRHRFRKQGLCTTCGKQPIAGKNWCTRCGFRCAVNNKGLSQEEKNKAWELFRSFEGRCQCCGTGNPGKRRFCLDHKGGKVRGIICSKCNVALGYLRDDAEIAEKAAHYLQRTNVL